MEYGSTSVVREVVVALLATVVALELVVHRHIVLVDTLRLLLDHEI